ncbi:MAG: T9SS type A sorting domain-containing protein [Bacteroidetes bacterium]|nr:T9SS type A sorting domain-containing protein [Bacteroidota bacterium]
MIKYLSQKLVKAAAIVALIGLTGVAEAQSWSQAGPIYNAGRARNMVVDKNDPSGNTMYVGSASSGVFFTNDGGVNWSALVLANNQLNVSYMAQAADGKIYVATGEGFLRPGQKLKAQPGTGLYVINGASLTLVASSTVVGTVINRIACSPSNANKMALATSLGVMTGDVTNPSSFVVAVPTTTLVSGQDVKFDNSGILYFSQGNETSIGSAAAEASKVYKSTDNTLSSFTQLSNLNSSLLQNDIFGRIELAISPTNNSVIYASCASKFAGTAGPASPNLKGLFVSYDAGASWGLILQGSPQLDPLMNGETFGPVIVGGTAASGDYAHVITVDPFDSDQLYIGSYQFYYWKRTGGPNSNPVGTWTKKGVTFIPNSQFFLARNIHDIQFIKSGSSISKFFFITDAGIYRSTDVLNGQFGLTSFQPFYKGLITGQFNSVSIERFPLAAGSATSSPGTQVIPYSGFIGGTGGNGLNYFSGNFPNVTQENVYSSGDVYQSEFSKILPNAAYFTQGSGKLFRTTDVRSSDPVQVDLLVNSKLQTILPYDNTTYNVTGTPFKLWETYGQTTANPDSAVFYNDTLRFSASMVGVATLTSQSTFSFSAARPNKFASIDSIVFRTGVVELPITCSTKTISFNAPGDKKDINIKLANSYNVPASGTLSPTITQSLGPVASASVIVNSNTYLDNISVTFTAPPFANKTTVSVSCVPDAAAYYRVFCTVFYKYKIGDSVKVVDDRISTKTSTYTSVLTSPVSWAYGNSQPAYTLAAANASAIVNPTFVLTPGNFTQTSNPTFTVRPITTTNYTITSTGTFTFGTYTVTGKPVTHTLTAPSTPNATFVLTPGSITQTVSTFTVAPTATTSTIYTVTATNSSNTVTTTFSVAPSTYSLEPGSVTQLSPIFTIVATPTNPTSTYSITGLSSNTLTGNDTYTTGAITVITVTNNLGYFLAAVPPNNKPVKIEMGTSARMAMGYGANVYVSNAPLSLNNPLSMINVSADKCLTTDAAGNKLAGPSNTVAVSGTVTALEWSKNGTELYYATNDPLSGNKFLYRVSYLDALMDSTAKSYSGKLHTNVFVFNTGTVATSFAPDGTKNNPRSPYRTALLGGPYTKIITGISVTNDDKAIAVTFDDPAGTKILYSTVADVRKCNFTNVALVSKTGTGLPTTKIYCSLMEKSDNKKVFLGTDFGVYTTNDITAATPTWVDANNNQLPPLQVFDIKQQVMRSWDCYNGGVIYAATNGRGVWMNKDYQVNYFVGVDELPAVKLENNMSIYPNPTNGNVNILFTAADGESATINIMDINGRVVKNENLGKLTSGDLTYVFETTELASGMYIVNINGTSGTKRVAKLIVTK